MTEHVSYKEYNIYSYIHDISRTENVSILSL